MATLVLPVVSDELLQRLSKMASVDRVAVPELAVQLIEDGLARRTPGLTRNAKTGKEFEDLLAEIQRNQIPYAPGEPTVVELLREDRNR